MPGHLESVKKRKLYLGEKPQAQLCFTQVCVPPPISHLQLFKSWDFVRGSWFSIAHGQAFSWEEVIVLAGKDFSPLLTHSVAGYLVVFTPRPPKFGFILNFSTFLWGPLILRGNMREKFFSVPCSVPHDSAKDCG